MDEWTAWISRQAIEWLRSIRDNQRDVKRLQDEIDIQRSMALPQGIDYSKTSVSSSTSGGSLEKAAMRIIELIEEYTVKMDDYISIQHDAHNRLMMIDDARYRNVLIEYYLLGKEWSDVGRALHFESNYCRQLRNESLPYVYEVMPTEFKEIIPRAD